jgi:uncharacterized RDD family membrane protein YckC
MPVWLRRQTGFAAIVWGVTVRFADVTFRYAGFWIRFLATLIDWVILYGVSWLVQLPLPINPNGLMAQVIDSAVYTALATPYFVYGHYKYQTTPGKRALRLYVVREDNGLPITLKQSWGRYISYLISYLPLGCGYLMVLIQPKKQGLHDLIAGTICVREVRTRPS